MIWLALRRFWPYLLGAGVIIAAGWYIHHAGYESGYAAREAFWRPKFEAADRARTEANARAIALETASKALSANYEAKHAETVASLNLRAADAQRRIDGLLRELAASSRNREVPKAGGAATVSDAPTAGDEFLAAAGVDLTEIARRCEADAAQLGELQSWVREQFAIFQ